MSDPKLVSPLLDGFVMGESISDHDGVCCCPAMRENSDNKYIVKIISVPASQKQLDALLLTGAYHDVADAMEYFKELSDGVVAEAELLKKLSAGKGFLAYQDWQVVPMEKNRLGYQIYLLSDYRRSLERYLRRNPMTHLGAVNLALDLCAALAECRKAGYLYVGIKPTNIFVDEQKRYRLGDLGFIPLNSLQFTSLPSKYRSNYTAPELSDPMATIGSTVDIYAVGLVLYQIYNNGQLPVQKDDSNQPLPAPLNADYEMAEIILKACAPDPKDRWQSPIDMGAALVAYMQRNIINDTPIIPPIAQQGTAVEKGESSEGTDDTQAPVEESTEEIAFLNTLISDDTAPGSDLEDTVSEGEMSDEINSMLAQADELISHETPDPVVAPDPIEVPVPPLDLSVDETSAVEDAAADEVKDSTEDEDSTPVEETEDTAKTSSKKLRPELFVEEPLDDPNEKKKKHRWVIPVLLVLALLAGGAYWFYQSYYLQPIDKMEVLPVENRVTINLTTEIDESLLTVVCTDTYGNALQSAVQNGQATFTDLNPGTQYKITVNIDGFHQVTGSTSCSFTTQEQTKIVNLNAVTGAEDGSVILNFSVDGKDAQDWAMVYSAEGEDEQRVSFTGHTVTIPGLTVGNVYNFRLEPTAELYMVGDSSLQYTASKVVVAENVAVAACTNTTLTIKWDTPADTQVESWSVRCYTEDGYEQTVTVTENAAEFTDISVGSAYTVEVTASGMTQSARAYITANPITITDFNVSEKNPSTLNVTWSCEGTPSGDGWLLAYTLGEGQEPVTVTCSTNSAEIPLYPSAEYRFTLQSADGTSVFNSEHSYKSADAKAFEGYGLLASFMESSLCKTPSKANWSYKNVAKGDYTTSFASGESASIIIYISRRFYRPNDDMKIMYIIRDSAGNAISNLIATEDKVWRNMWNDGHCALTIPNMPTAPGDYTVDVYFNGAAALSKKFSIT